MVGGWLAGEKASVTVSLDARVSFARAFGLEPEEQVRLERSFGPLDLSRWDDYEPCQIAELAVPGLCETVIDGSI